MNVFGIARSLVNPVNLASLAMGPAGWANIAARTLMAQAGMNIIQQVGQRMGLAQPIIDLAQASVAGSAGLPGLARQNMFEAVQGMPGLSLREAGEMARGLDSAIDRLVSSLAESQDAKEARATGGGKTWIMALASALGKKLDAKAAQVENLANAINDKKPSTTAKFGAAAQEFNILMSASTTAIKTMGEAAAGMARKQ